MECISPIVSGAVTVGHSFYLRRRSLADARPGGRCQICELATRYFLSKFFSSAVCAQRIARFENGLLSFNAFRSRHAERRGQYGKRDGHPSVGVGQCLDCTLGWYSLADNAALCRWVEETVQPDQTFEPIPNFISKDRRRKS